MKSQSEIIADAYGRLGRRLPSRRVDLETAVRESFGRAQVAEDGVDISVARGGGTSHNYNPRALSECALVVTRRDGALCIYVEKVRAKTASPSTIACLLFGEAARPIFDVKYSESRRKGARRCIVSRCFGIGEGINIGIGSLKTQCSRLLAK